MAVTASHSISDMLGGVLGGFRYTMSGWQPDQPCVAATFYTGDALGSFNAGCVCSPGCYLVIGIVWFAIRACATFNGPLTRLH